MKTALTIGAILLAVFVIGHCARARDYDATSVGYQRGYSQ